MAANESGDYGPGEPGEGGRDKVTFPGTDIYVEWALGAGRADFFASEDQQVWIPLLLELTGISAAEFASGELFAPIDKKTWQESVRVPGLYLDERGLGYGRDCETVYLTALVQEVFFLDYLESNARLQKAVSRLKLGAPLDRRSLDPMFFDSHTRQPQHDEAGDARSDPSDDPPSEGVVILGIIDDGIAFGHQRFWRGNRQTRVRYAWLQDSVPGVGGPLLGVAFNGIELTNADIDRLLTASASAGSVDEDLFYQRAGAVDFNRQIHKSVARRASHGAHVMDVAAGYDYRDPADQPHLDARPIICVQLPTEVTAETSGGTLECYLLEAIDYILRRADDIACERGTGPLPVVINFSYGHYAEPHDGTGVLEAAIDQRIRQRMRTCGVPLRMVLPSGNSHLSRTHARLSFQAVGETRSLEWRVLPDDKSPSFVEIWLPRGAPADRIEVSVTAPTGETTTRLAEDTSRSERLPPGAPPDAEICLVDYRHEPVADRGTYLITLQPTERLQPAGDPVAPPGVWRVHLTNLAFGPDEVVHAWIGRDDTPLGFPIHGRQSYFDQGCYARYDESGRPIEEDVPADCEIVRGGTISGLATGQETIVIGGYYRRETRPAEYSAGGPTNGAPRRGGPDATAVSDDTVVHRGILAAGTHSGSVVALDGTSIAAPQVARRVADALAAGGAGDRADVAGWAVPFTDPPVSPERGGAGMVDAPPVVRINRY